MCLLSMLLSLVAYMLCVPCLNINDVVLSMYGLCLCVFIVIFSVVLVSLSLFN